MYTSPIHTQVAERAFRRLRLSGSVHEVSKVVRRVMALSLPFGFGFLNIFSMVAIPFHSRSIKHPEPHCVNLDPQSPVADLFEHGSETTEEGCRSGRTCPERRICIWEFPIIRDA